MKPYPSRTPFSAENRPVKGLKLDALMAIGVHRPRLGHTKMRRNFVLSIPFVLLVGCTTHTPGGHRDGRLREIETREIHGLLASEIASGRYIDVNFILRNQSRTPCEARLISKSCGCVGVYAGPADLSLEEGQSVTVSTRGGSVRLRVNPGSTPGVKRQSATFEMAGGPSRPARVIELDVIIDVVADVSVSPAALEFRLADRSSARVSRSLRIKHVCRRGKVREPPNLGRIPPFLAQSAAPTLVSRECSNNLLIDTWMINFSLSDADIPSSTYDTLSVGFRDQPSRQTVPLSFLRSDGIEAIPKSVIIVTPDDGARVSRILLLRSRGGRDFTVERITSIIPGFSARILSSISQPKHLVEVSFPPRIRVGARDALEITTDDPASPRARDCWSMSPSLEIDGLCSFRSTLTLEQVTVNSTPRSPRRRLAGSPHRAGGEPHRCAYSIDPRSMPGNMA